MVRPDTRPHQERHMAPGRALHSRAVLARHKVGQRVDHMVARWHTQGGCYMRVVVDVRHCPSESLVSAVTSWSLTGTCPEDALLWRSAGRSAWRHRAAVAAAAVAETSSRTVAAGVVLFRWNVLYSSRASVS